VTFREHDSLPAHLHEQLRRLREILLVEMDDDRRFLRADRAYFARMIRFLNEGHGACRLRDPRASAAVLEAMEHFAGDRYELGDRKVLPNHVHVLVRPLPGFELEAILHSWKSYTAKAINSLLGRSGPVWQQESYDRLVRDSSELGRTER
jgi:putative DNA methylase